MARIAFERDDCELEAPLLDVAQTASSGTAAMRIDGQTLHRWLGIGPITTTKAIIKRILDNEATHARILAAQVLFIDE